MQVEKSLGWARQHCQMAAPIANPSVICRAVVIVWLDADLIRPSRRHQLIVTLLLRTLPFLEIPDLPPALDLQLLDLGPVALLHRLCPDRSMFTNLSGRLAPLHAVLLSHRLQNFLALAARLAGNIDRSHEAGKQCALLLRHQADLTGLPSLQGRADIRSELLLRPGAHESGFCIAPRPCLLRLASPWPADRN